MTKVCFVNNSLGMILLSLTTASILQLSTLVSCVSASNSSTPREPQCNVKLYKITGNIYSLQHDDLSSLRISLMNTKILVNHGQFVGYVKEDGSFEVDNLPSDSYVVEIAHPKYIYDTARVDITSKGKIRARRVDNIQPSLVQTIDYPLKFNPKSLHNYFQPRETWHVMDLLLNPMVIMMVVPLLIVWVLPKLISPQEVAQSQRDTMQMPEYNVPELSEMMANMFGRQSGDSAACQALPTGSNQGGSNSGGGGSNQRHGKTKRK